MARNATIKGWGKYLPEKVLTNHDLEQIVDTTDAWIFSRTGIRERRIAASNETTSDMAINAARDALKVGGLDASDLDLIIVATCTSEYIFPACAAVVQKSLGATKAATFDTNTACSGFIYALGIAYQFIKAETYNNILVIGSDIYSRILDWKDRNTCVLFGDGAGAVLLQSSKSSKGCLSVVLGSDGSGVDHLYTPGPCGINDKPYVVNMNGREVYRFAINIICQATRQAIENAKLDIADIELFIPHQANIRILKSATRALAIPQDRLFINVDRYGNTSAASIPIALCEAIEAGLLNTGDHVALVGFGGGLSWASTVIEWGI